MKRNIALTKIFLELASELGYITCIGIIGTYNCCDSIWWVPEDSAISKPARSRLIKLMGKEWISGEVAAATKHDMVANICK